MLINDFLINKFFKKISLKINNKKKIKKDNKIFNKKNIYNYLINTIYNKIQIKKIYFSLMILKQINRISIKI